MVRPIIVWIRRDLRINDHMALYHASLKGKPVIPVFILDNELIRSLPSDGAVFNFQAEALVELDDAIRTLGGRLIIRKGNPLQVHRALIKELQPEALFYNRDYEPYARVRDEEINDLYNRNSIPVETFKDHVLLEPHEVLTGNNDPYSIFSPYMRRWKTIPKSAPVGKPKKFSTPAIPSDKIHFAADLKKKVTIPHPAFIGGISQAEKTWKHFLRTGLSSYGDTRNIPSIQGTSRISPYLRFGCISIRTLYNDVTTALEQAPASTSASVESYLNELIWREFYQAVLFHMPWLLQHNFRRQFDALPWKLDETLLRAWQKGRTGYPLVDAGMRELNETGWMHNRVRMVVASFFTKHLMHDWKLGEQYFEQKLLDIEKASNNGGWQWSASTGVDPRPLRIFNPILQSEKFDANGDYIKTFVPELRQVPGKYIHQPWLMPPLVQQEAKCVIGRDYPAPVVDHADASRRYKEMFTGVQRRRVRT